MESVRTTSSESPPPIPRPKLSVKAVAAIAVAFATLVLTVAYFVSVWAHAHYEESIPPWNWEPGSRRFVWSDPITSTLLIGALCFSLSLVVANKCRRAWVVALCLAVPFIAMALSLFTRWSQPTAFVEKHYIRGLREFATGKLDPERFLAWAEGVSASQNSRSHSDVIAHKNFPEFLKDALGQARPVAYVFKIEEQSPYLLMLKFGGGEESWGIIARKAGAPAMTEGKWVKLWHERLYFFYGPPRLWPDGPERKFVK